MFISIPLSIDINNHTGFNKEADIRLSIKSFLDLLVSSYQGSSDADPQFGFIFKNFRFENFNEDKGVLFSANADDNYAIFHKHKIHGRSTNLNTFAHDLKKSIEKYENRLSNVNVDMKYVTVEKMIYIEITGLVGQEIKEKFSHTIPIHVW